MVSQKIRKKNVGVFYDISLSEEDLLELEKDSKVAITNGKDYCGRTERGLSQFDKEWEQVNRDIEGFNRSLRKKCGEYREDR